MTRRFLLLTPAILALALLTACEPKVTLENYDKINNGMTLAQVEHILGSGTEDSASGGFGIGSSSMLTASGSQQRIFVWKEENRQIVVTFQEGKVVNKHNKGL
jgi:hypothetical protein